MAPSWPGPGVGRLVRAPASSWAVLGKRPALAMAHQGSPWSRRARSPDRVHLPGLEQCDKALLSGLEGGVLGIRKPWCQYLRADLIPLGMMMVMAPHADNSLWLTKPSNACELRLLHNLAGPAH